MKKRATPLKPRRFVKAYGTMKNLRVEPEKQECPHGILTGRMCMYCSIDRLKKVESK
jgi:hypothetical protein